jgi:hypothetical protein
MIMYVCTDRTAQQTIRKTRGKYERGGAGCDHSGIRVKSQVPLLHMPSWMLKATKMSQWTLGSSWDTRQTRSRKLGGAIMVPAQHV